uniref:NADH-ubiquinone oxidoreductase chain 1 n=1 Tax=Asymmetron lucayanum TaxID=223987 RepID=Q5TMD1_9BRAN|nr:NADH dehydrogenase subunit 1 [Asymmetron lucayanum]BAD72153.1 NADH dehydrogenase subunit 1 [Asymmetron lucayanum]BAV13729.1 NADH dehydrogenase subunit 1 [Asymmetron lucayanum]
MLYISVIHLFLYFVPVLLAVAFLTLTERKVIGYVQLRKGPNVVGPYGLLQPIADGVKLFIKEPIKPSSSIPQLFFFAPMLALILALLLWIPIPMADAFIELNFGVLFVLAISSLSVYSLMGSGWASNSKYALIGALRAVAQMVSYEVSLGLIILSLICLIGSFSLNQFLTAQEETLLLFSCWPLAIMWFISTVAETNRSPFDLTEGESELVSGFNVEYSGGPFALFFLAEYANILFMNILSVVLFLSFYLTLADMALKASLLVGFYLWFRASYPRFRYDQLMHLAWKSFLPMSLGLLLLNFSLPVIFSGLGPGN